MATFKVIVSVDTDEDMSTEEVKDALSMYLDNGEGEVGTVEALTVTEVKACEVCAGPIGIAGGPLVWLSEAKFVCLKCAHAALPSQQHKRAEA